MTAKPHDETGERMSPEIDEIRRSQAGLFVVMTELDPIVTEDGQTLSFMNVQTAKAGDFIRMLAAAMTNEEIAELNRLRSAEIGLPSGYRAQ